MTTTLTEHAKAIFLEREQLLPPASPTATDGDNEQPSLTNNRFVPPAPFYCGAKIHIVQLARCVMINISDPTSDDQQQFCDGDEEQQAKLADKICVNLCQLPALGATVAIVPRSEGQVSSTTLLETATGGAASNAAATADATAMGSGSSQECIARAVGERLVLRCQRNLLKTQQQQQQQQEQQKDNSRQLLCDKLVVCNCGLALGAGVNPRHGAEFLSMALDSPLFVANIVNAAAELLQI